MQPTQKTHTLRLASLPFLRTITVGALAAGMITTTQAVNVDSELVLLVDTTSSSLNNSQYSSLMNAYASTFSSSQILDSIQMGAYKKIAVSLMFFGASNSVQVGIPWMEIGNSTQALQFASLLQSVVRPGSGGTTDIPSALTNATASFGTETGGPANGFESRAQIIEVAAARKPNSTMAAPSATSRNAALAAGVDMINSLSLGNQAATIDAFYTANVIGSTIPGAPATSETSLLNGTLAANLSAALNASIQTGAAYSVSTAVPETSSSLIVASGVLFFLGRRRS